MTKPDTIPHPSLARPHDAATLVLVRRDGPSPRILMGKRHESHKFMPGKFVFPGGRVDPGDCRLKLQSCLDETVCQKLQMRMKGKPSVARAHGIALAAVRETFEEVGFLIGKKGSPSRTKNVAWQQFFSTGYVPDISGLRYLARAITPPRRPRRFDTRFLMADASIIANIDDPISPGSDELLAPHWVTLEQARQLDLPWITGQILDRLETALQASDPFAQQASVTYQFMRGKSWTYETL